MRGSRLALSVFQILFFCPTCFAFGFGCLLAPKVIQSNTFSSTMQNVYYFSMFSAQLNKFRPLLKVRSLPHNHNFQTFQHILSALALDLALTTSQCIVLICCFEIKSWMCLDTQLDVRHFQPTVCPLLCSSRPNGAFTNLCTGQHRTCKTPSLETRSP